MFQMPGRKLFLQIRVGLALLLSALSLRLRKSNHPFISFRGVAKEWPVSSKSLESLLHFGLLSFTGFDLWGRGINFLELNQWIFFGCRESCK